ncbi:uncharacterized protein EI90DRAFT_2274470 [Cantharellus anzutake]|uniref:uncharacterized protein n=1 Tax=Cantharellus anzutake TaxID=1750568 RepID=UPI001902D2DC|nr:uncharacterized protein EI90DRAFT_2274470 [Cantharellus anzutake]KAF8339723.1 hypothetical protein EI90DRAFT_2274470 [Cantharellus anzutake]
MANARVCTERPYAERQSAEGVAQTRSRRHTEPTPILTLTDLPSIGVGGESIERPSGDGHFEVQVTGQTQDARYSTDILPDASSSAGCSYIDHLPSDASHLSVGTPSKSVGESEGQSMEGGGGGGGRVAKRKRSRVTPGQLAQLERAFAKDRSPTAAKRKEITEMLGMQERQTQVWFQNRRAKAKLLEQRARASRLGGHPRLDPSSPLGSSSASTLSDPELRAMLHEDDPIFVVPCSDLSIGSFRRISAAHYDLLGYTCENRRTFSWYIYSAGTGFKMDIPYESISATEYADDAQPGQGRVALHLTQTPTFFRESASPSDSPSAPLRTWQPCDDWTEGRQATSCLRHEVVGAAALLEQVLSLMRVDPFSPMYAAANRSSSSFSSSGPSSSRHSPVNSISTPALPQVGLVASALAPPSSYVDPFGPRGSHIGHGRRRSRSNPTPYEPRRHSLPTRVAVSAGLSRRSTFAEQQRGPRTDHQTFSDLEFLPYSFNPSSDLLDDVALGDASTVPIARPISRRYTSTTASSSVHYPSRPGTSSSFTPNTSDMSHIVSAPQMGHYQSDSSQFSHIGHEGMHSPSSPCPHPLTQPNTSLPYQLPPDPALTQYGLHTTVDMGSMEDVDFDVLRNMNAVSSDVISPERAIDGPGSMHSGFASDYIPPDSQQNPLIPTEPLADLPAPLSQGNYLAYFP